MSSELQSLRKKTEELRNRLESDEDPRYLSAIYFMPIFSKEREYEYEGNYISRDGESLLLINSEEELEALVNILIQNGVISIVAVMPLDDDPVIYFDMGYAYCTSKVSPNPEITVMNENVRDAMKYFFKEWLVDKKIGVLREVYPGMWDYEEE